ncbi:heparin lyase I family protein [Bradyrhizobium jicamae]|uniref:Heparin lyase I family protein n=1 Tax=Bradyrhizobium jicamae TaxID=280332 RepID=A0ABS5FGQ9_9BRAD|nr:heparin lyase I family protein [Bradyrhizobium jicamae]MBR0795974.1 heparin lyase I family protein [Bradyrhizobium jicamae]
MKERIIAPTIFAAGFMAGLSSGIHCLAATDTHVAGNTSATSQPANAKAVGSITSFSARPRTRFQIDDTSYQVQGAGRSWSLSSPDSRTLRFEIRPGDYAWFDSSTVDRSEIASDQMIMSGTSANIAYTFMLEPGVTNTASWFVTAELHNDDEALGPNVHTSPPFAIELAGEHLRIVARHCPTGLNPSNRAGNLKILTLWTDPNPIRRGEFYDIKIQANLDNTSSGHLYVWANGDQVVNYHGPLGYGAPTYWEEGLYRSADATQTVAASFRNLRITTGRDDL